MSSTIEQILINNSNADAGIDHTDSGSLITFIGLPFLLYSILTCCCLVLFGIFLHFGWVLDDLTPRVANRNPQQMLHTALYYDEITEENNKIDKNQKKEEDAKEVKNEEREEKKTTTPVFSSVWLWLQLCYEHIKSIVWYPLAWIKWSYLLTLKQCLFGIPGTGTRNGGLHGPLLKVNVDGVVLLKYHTMLFKIALLVALLSTIILLPVYMTASCDPIIFGYGTCYYQEEQTKNNDFLCTTIFNLPPKLYNNNTENITASDVTYTLTTSVFSDLNPLATNQTVQGLPKQGWIKNYTWRIYSAVICCVITYIYTLYLLQQEWIENIALRRIFFLERDHYSICKDTLSKLAIDKDNDGIDDFDGGEFHSDDLPPYLLHPEIMDTPPSIGLYSVLYKFPKAMVTYDTDGASQVDRELIAARDFFDEIVPPICGYSSSVAAVTVLPNSFQVARCWSKWSICETKIQKLKHIRMLIEKKSQHEVVGDIEKNQDTNSSPSAVNDSHDETTSPEELVCEKNDNDGNAETVFKMTDYDDKNEDTSENNGSKTDPNSTEVSISKEVLAAPPIPSMLTSKSEYRNGFMYADFDVKSYAKTRGLCEEVEEMREFLDGMGIFEFNIFAYNCAMMASGPGIYKKLLYFNDLDALKEEAECLKDELIEANNLLIETRNNLQLQDDNELIEANDLVSRSFQEKHDDAIRQSCFGDDDSHDASFVPSILRQRHSGSFKKDDEEQWQRAQRETEMMIHGSNSSQQGFFSRIFCWKGGDTISPKYYGLNTEHDGQAYVTDHKHPSYVVVTFTSVKAAIIARQCLADGGATNSWEVGKDFPIYPLADAPPSLFYPRGICRPVTPNITYLSKKIRMWSMNMFMISFTALWIIPINLINRSILDPEKISTWFPFITVETATKFVTPLSGLSQNLLFSICPTFFKYIACKDGKSTSVQQMEQRAMMYFWYFFIVARYLGQFLAIAVLQLFFQGRSIDAALSTLLTSVANTIPTTLGPTALSYMLSSSLFSLPLFYLLQASNIGTKIISPWINRIMKGGGSGTLVPYRIYIDSGYIFSCVISMAPLCPLLGSFGLIYFIVISPILRWLVVFTYRPQFDAGGIFWPKLHNVIITSLLLGQFLTSITLVLKGNLIPGAIVFVCIIPTIAGNRILLEKYKRPFLDAALLQTGRLQHNENSLHKATWTEREEFRRWLVDCHKASYVPTCLSGCKDNLVTVEPCCVEDVGGDGREDKRELFKRQNAQKGGITSAMCRQKYDPQED